MKEMFPHYMLPCSEFFKCNSYFFLLKQRYKWKILPVKEIPGCIIKQPYMVGFHLAAWVSGSACVCFSKKMIQNICCEQGFRHQWNPLNPICFFFKYANITDDEAFCSTFWINLYSSSNNEVSVCWIWRFFIWNGVKKVLSTLTAHYSRETLIPSKPVMDELR